MWGVALIAGIVFHVNALIIVLIGLGIGVLRVVVAAKTGKKVQP